MIREIVKDPIFLAKKSVPATPKDKAIAADLMQTLYAHKDHCVGMAANMIGESKRIIAFFDGDMVTPMFNPEIIAKSGKYDAEEGCLSLSGTRPAERYFSITVSYQDINFTKRTKEYSEFTAEIIQHEIDHCNGILI